MFQTFIGVLYTRFYYFHVNLTEKKDDSLEKSKQGGESCEKTEGSQA